MIIRRPAPPGRLLAAALLGLAVAASAPGPVPAPIPASAPGPVSASSPGPALRWSVAPATADGPDGRTRFSYSEVRPGAVVHDHVSITNLSDTPVTFRVYAADGITTAEGSIGAATADTKPTDLGVWTRVARARVRVPARARVVEPITIAVPANATPGDHVGAVIASITERAAGGTVARENRFAVAAYLRVAGALTPALAVEAVSTSYRGTANPFGGGTGTVAYTVRNTGNVRLGGRQTVAISGPFGTRATGHPADLTELLPGDSVRVTARLPGVVPAGALTARVTVVPREVTGAPPVPAGLAPASYLAGLWATPWPQLLLLAFVLAGGAGLWWWLRRRRRRLAERLAAAVERGRREGARAPLPVAVAVLVGTLTGTLAGALGGAFGGTLGGGLLGGTVGAAPRAEAGTGAGTGDGSKPVTVTIPRHAMPELTCAGPGGVPLGENPTLHPGGQLSCTGIRFTAGERVAVTIDPRSREAGTVTAGPDGTARHEMSLPGNLGAGRYTLTFTGRTSQTVARYPFTVTIVAELPVGGGTGGGAGGDGGLPRTGAGVLRIAGVGAALVAVGALTVAGSRRRTRRRAPTGRPPLPNGEPA